MKCSNKAVKDLYWDEFGKFVLVFLDEFPFASALISFYPTKKKQQELYENCEKRFCKHDSGITSFAKS